MQPGSSQKALIVAALPRSYRVSLLGWLAGWLLPIAALSINPPVPTPIPTPVSASQDGTGSSSLPPEEDHHSAPTGVALRSEVSRKAKKGARRSPRLHLHLPSLQTLQPTPDLRDLHLRADTFFLKLHRAQLPRRTGPTDSDPELS